VPGRRRGRVRELRPGRAVPGCSDGWVLRDRGQAGWLVPEDHPARRRRPVRGAVRAERDAGGSRVITGFRFPAAEEPDRATLLRDQPDRLCHSLAGSTDEGQRLGAARPGRTRRGTGPSLNTPEVSPPAHADERTFSFRMLINRTQSLIEAPTCDRLCARFELRAFARESSDPGSYAAGT
jgi:hypothetical protein